MRFSTKFLLASVVLAFGCFQSVPVVFAAPDAKAPSHKERAVSPAIDTTIKVIGNAKGGMYSKLQGTVPGGTLNLVLEKKTTVFDAGGIMVEGNPNFFVTGDIAGKKVTLKIVPEDLIADVGGMKVQTGTIYHITGKLAAQKVVTNLTHEETVSNVGGVNIQTEVWASLKSSTAKGPRFELRHISVVADGPGGIKIEKETYHTWKGDNNGTTSDFTVRNWIGEEDAIEVSGKGSIESLALLLALRPFMNI